MEIEIAGAAFFRKLAKKRVAPPVREFLLRLAEQEEIEARNVELVGRRLLRGEPASRPDIGVTWVRTLPDWERAVALSADEAVEVARACDYSAALYYDALADACPSGEGFLRSLARAAEEGVLELEPLMRRARRAVLSPGRRRGPL